MKNKMKICLPFYDDSTLIFASMMHRKLESRGHHCTLIQYSETDDQDEISDRQIGIYLDGKSYNKVITEDLYEYCSDYSAVIYGKAPREINDRLRRAHHESEMDRPCYISFKPGLEFTPDKGYKNRRYFDAVFMTNSDHVAIANTPPIMINRQHVSFGHPNFDLGKNIPVALGSGDIVFFVQSICPATLKGRIFMIQLLAAIARRHPDRNVIVKLRHLPDENRVHVHKELYSYPDIIDRHFPDRPKNLIFSAVSTEEALKNAAYCITCTSTAAMDAITHGVPCGVYINYVENYFDLLVPKMEREFEGSGLIMTTEEILNLTVRQPSPYWVEKFYNPNLMTEIENVIDSFHKSAIND